MDFSDVLASAVHDIKNSLGMVINTLEELTGTPDSELGDHPKAKLLQLEARRANNDLIQLLTLYKLQNELANAHILEHNLEDFLDDLVVENRALAEALEINLDYRCDPFLNGFFDEDLLRGVLNNAIGNAERYTSDQIIISADAVDDYTVIRIEDNGKGFPQAMLEQQANSNPSPVCNRGRTQLGLYFSDKIAKLHRKSDRVGFIRLENEVNLNGGCFSIWIP